MKANIKHRDRFSTDRKAYSFIVPLTIAFVIGFSLLTIGAYVVGTLNSALEETYEDNVATGSISIKYEDDATVSGSHKMNLTGTNAGELTGDSSYFYIHAGIHAVEYSLTVNGQEVNRSDNISEGEGWNVTFTYLLSNSSINSSDAVITFDYTVTTDTSAIDMVAAGSYYQSADYRKDNENRTILLMGNITDGFSSVVDIEIVVIIITALSMAILSIMAVGSRRSAF